MPLEREVLHSFRELRIHQSYWFRQLRLFMLIPISVRLIQCSLVNIFFLGFLVGSQFLLFDLQALGQFLLQLLCIFAVVHFLDDTSLDLSVNRELVC